MRKTISFDDAAKLTVEKLKELGPGPHSISTADLADIVVSVKGLANKHNTECWKPVFPILAELLNTTIPEGRVSKSKIVVFEFTEEKPVTQEAIKFDDSRIIFFTYRFNTLSKLNRRENMLILPEAAIVDMGTTITELLDLIKYLGADSATLLSDDEGNYNFQGFDVFITALRTEERKIQSQKRKESLDSVLNKGLGKNDDPLCNELIAFFKSYNPDTEELDYKLVTPNIKNFFQKHFNEIKLPDKECSLMLFKKKKTNASVKETFERIRQLIGNEEPEETEKESQEPLPLSNRVENFMIFDFIKSCNTVPTNLTIKSINDKNIIYEVKIVGIDVDIVKTVLEKLECLTINIDCKKNESIFIISYNISNPLEYKWITNI